MRQARERSEASLYRDPSLRLRVTDQHLCGTPLVASHVVPHIGDGLVHRHAHAAP